MKLCALYSAINWPFQPIFYVPIPMKIPHHLYSDRIITFRIIFSGNLFLILKRCKHENNTHCLLQSKTEYCRSKMYYWAHFLYPYLVSAKRKILSIFDVKLWPAESMYHAWPDFKIGIWALYIRLQYSFISQCITLSTYFTSECIPSYRCVSIERVDKICVASYNNLTIILKTFLNDAWECAATFSWLKSFQCILLA